MNGKTEPEKLYLYEIPTTGIGMSYERIYVIEDNDESALQKAFDQLKNTDWWTVNSKVTIDDMKKGLVKIPIEKGFVSMPSDEGLVIESLETNKISVFTTNPSTILNNILKPPNRTTKG